ncbi:MAG TPA: prolipoprotein diacylglyceryl transferase family protein [Candidatus Deferrimicrobiaceae bacterium]
MLPYFSQPSWHIYGPLTVHSFGLIVAVAVLTGSHLAMRRCRAKGLSPDLCADLVFYTVISGFVMAHLYSVLAYFPHQLLTDPLLLFRIWEDISSFGGIVGGVLGIWLFFRLKGKGLDRAARLGYLDAIAWAFPFAWAIGRLACTTAHDHPGTVTTFPLAISLESETARGVIAGFYKEAGRLADLPPWDRLATMGFHDLGWYEFLYTLFVICPLFLLFDRKPRPGGFFPLLFVSLYIPVRFAFDFLRIADTRYLGLTPGQWAALAVLPFVAWAMRRVLRSSPPADASLPG